MADGPGLELGMAPQLRALPGLLQALALLPLPHAALDARIDRALAENPTLRRRPGSPCSGCGRHGRGDCPYCPRGPRLTAEPAVDPFAELEVRAGWEIRADARPALPVVVGRLTERGLLPEPLDEIAAAHGLTTAVVAEAVRALRAAGPPGIAEPTVPDLLHAQACALVAAGRAPAALPDLVRDHLPAVADSDLDGPAAALGLPVAAVAELVALVRTRLRPSVGLGPAPPRTVPDVLVDRSADGTLRVEVADSRWYGLAVATTPRRLRADPEAAAWLGAHERAARDLIRQLDSRAGVLRRVATAAVAHQAGFLERGPAAHRDLTRADVAAAVAVHPSTVSRAVAGKALRTPDGRVLELAALFGRAVPVKTRIAELAPRRLSDERLRAVLAAEGHVLARRTVTKYRAGLRGRS